MVNSDMHGKGSEGLTTSEALKVLHSDIQLVLNQFLASQQTRNSKLWIRNALHHRSFHTTITWISVVYIALIIITQCIIFTKTYEDSLWIFCQPIIILLMLILSIFLEVMDNKLRHTEIAKRVQDVLRKIYLESMRNSWLPENYPNNYIPFSPSITLQWTYRDNKLVNLPWALLVKDDIILIRPGQISPGFCEALEKCSEYQLLHARQVYGPSLQSANECFAMPKSRKPLESRKYKLLETPYINNLKIFLDKVMDRPITLENRLRRFLMMTVIERALFPLILSMSLFANALKFAYFNSSKYLKFWDVIACTVATVMPLLPLIFPLAWNCINYFGIARYKTFIELLHLEHRHTISMDEDDVLDNPKYNFKFKDVWNTFIGILKGNEVMLGRTTNLLHVLGSLTALCCVDKKGILSWPNPSAEKVFFLHNGAGEVTEASKLNTADADSMQFTDIAVAEVLDITHHQNDPFQLHFDNTKWDKYLNSLKPLGLSVLLNTCNIETQESYTKFCSHITCEAMYNENLIPVTNRRCLCELAKEIGFVEKAQQVFSLKQQLCTFRHLPNDVARRDSKFARSLNLPTKLKFPFPHMFAVVVKESYGGSTQLLAQGTADIILDACVDYWNGSELRTLSSLDRRKVQDFYQRSSLTAYCTAFAYRPLHRGLNRKLDKTYLELPRECKQLYLSHRSPTPLHYETENQYCPNVMEDCSSTDSLLQNDSSSSDTSDVENCFEMQCNQVFIGMVTMQYQVQQDMVNLVEQLEKGCIRFVHFSKENELRSRVFNEKMGLESGWNCHISLLSERSRRESGPSECWANNGTVRVSSLADLPRHAGDSSTHKFHSNKLMIPKLETISMAESAKALSYSAPGAINIEHSVVKFDNERKPLTLHIYDQETDITTNEHDTAEHDVANMAHEWQSLSCLTDSTENAPVNFDMSNRAMLPRGIENIRPHIENVDNVPLLVSLFTDCTPSNTKEMIKIMQEYGEIICVIGSSASNENSGIFMQANASISVEPLYPQVCCKTDNYKPVINGSISPIELSRVLNSIPCSLSMRREDPLTIYYLIVEARAFTALLRNTMQFWLCSCITISIMQLLTSLLMFPPLLTMGQVLWICCLIIPLLSVSLMGSPIEREFMKKPQGKNQIGFSFQSLMFIVRYYGLKFVPMVIIVILAYCGVLVSYCNDGCIGQNCRCKYFVYPDLLVNPSTFNESIERAQHFCVILVLLHLVTISISFVHRQESIWQKSPHKNYVWLGIIIFLFLLQIGFTFRGLAQIGVQYENYTGIHVGTLTAIFGFCSPLITFFICELVKRQEIKENIRYERRRKLEFDTKLGMNSPF